MASKNGVFMEQFSLSLQPGSCSPYGLPLTGLTFSVKDIFDVDGYVTGFGNPDWAKSHAPSRSTALSVSSILKGGGTCVGKTVMDEMAYSINGENIHYGTPSNPCAPDRVPGGSSSGSAVSVAAGFVDFSLGTDTAGSVRVPASYCGIFGFRPSHGAVSTEGVIPMAQSFDTVGWFARDPLILNQVGRVLLQLPRSDHPKPSQIIIPGDCFQLLSIPSHRVTEVLIKAVHNLCGSHIAVKHMNLGDFVRNEISSLENFYCEGNEAELHNNIPPLAALASAMRLLQRHEFKKNHGLWVRMVKPNLGPGILERVQEAIMVTDDKIGSSHSVKNQLRAALTELLEEFGILAIPTLPGPPPKLNMKSTLLESFRLKAFSLLSIAGLSGFCQVTIPLGMYENLPVAVSLLAKHGSDGFLLNFVENLYDNLKEQVEIAEKMYG